MNAENLGNLIGTVNKLIPTDIEGNEIKTIPEKSVKVTPDTIAPGETISSVRIDHKNIDLHLLLGELEEDGYLPDSEEIDEETGENITPKKPFELEIDGYVPHRTVLKDIGTAALHSQ